MAILNEEHHKLSENINYIPFALPVFFTAELKAKWDFINVTHEHQHTEAFGVIYLHTCTWLIWKSIYQNIQNCGQSKKKLVPVFYHDHRWNYGLMSQKKSITLRTPHFFLNLPVSDVHGPEQLTAHCACIVSRSAATLEGSPNAVHRSVLD